MTYYEELIDEIKKKHVYEKECVVQDIMDADKASNYLDGYVDGIGFALKRLIAHIMNGDIDVIDKIIENAKAPYIEPIYSIGDICYDKNSNQLFIVFSNEYDVDYANNIFAYDIIYPSDNNTEFKHIVEAESLVDNFKDYNVEGKDIMVDLNSVSMLKYYKKDIEFVNSSVDKIGKANLKEIAALKKAIKKLDEDMNAIYDIKK